MQSLCAAPHGIRYQATVKSRQFAAVSTSSSMNRVVRILHLLKDCIKHHAACPANTNDFVAGSLRNCESSMAAAILPPYLVKGDMQEYRAHSARYSSFTLCRARV
jgi:hypothetical protein